MKSLFPLNNLLLLLCSVVCCNALCDVCVCEREREREIERESERESMLGKEEREKKKK